VRRAAIAVLVAVGGCASTPARPPRSPPPSFAFDLGSVEPAPETYEDADLAHLRFLLTDDEVRTWETLDPAGRAEWFRAIWGRVDASPTTPENERKAEHYRRLAYARRQFAIDREPGWDRRGELLIRYGAPQSRTVIQPDARPVLGLSPPQEIWVYSWLGQAFRLADPMLRGDFQGGWADRTVISRRDLGFGNQPIDLGSTRSLESAGLALESRREAEEFERMLARGTEALAGTLPHAFWLDQGGAKLDFVFDVVCFAGEAARSRLEIHSAFAATDLEWSSATATVDMVAVAKTLDYEEVARVSHARSMPRGAPPRDRIALDLDPGPYRLALEARDRAGGKVGIFLTETMVPDFSASELALSDVQRCLDVRRASGPDPFRNGDWVVVPHPGGTYRAGTPVFLFFEVYHLARSPAGETFYTVGVTVRSRAPDGTVGEVVAGVGNAFDGRGRSATAQEFLALDPGALETSLYDVEVRVTDRISDRSVARTVTFGVDAG